MGLSIMTNELALNAQRHLHQTGLRYQGSLEKLSSGSRINRAGDDPAGLAISDHLTATIRSMGQAIRNAQDGISLIQVFEGGTNEINNMLIRARELAMQAGSDTIGDHERQMIQVEIDQIKAEISRVASTTEYAGVRILSGEETALDFQVGPNNNEFADRILFDPGDSNLTSEAIGLDGVELTTKTGAQESLDTIDTAIQRVDEVRLKVGATQSRLQTTIAAQQIFQENLMAANSRIRDTDITVETTNLAREQILRQSGISVLMQANQSPTVALKLLQG